MGILRMFAAGGPQNYSFFHKITILAPTYRILTPLIVAYHIIKCHEMVFWLLG